MQMVVTGWSDAVAAHHPAIKTVARVDSVFTVVAAPRYDAFRDAIRALAASNDSVRISEIAGNHDILITGVVPAGWAYRGGAARVMFTVPLPADATRQRVTMRVPVGELIAVMRQLDAEHRLAPRSAVPGPLCRKPLGRVPTFFGKRRRQRESQREGNGSLLSRDDPSLPAGIE